MTDNQTTHSRALSFSLTGWRAALAIVAVVSFFIAIGFVLGYAGSPSC
jgi:anti-sigma-K factor RskA